MHLWGRGVVWGTQTSQSMRNSSACPCIFALAALCNFRPATGLFLRGPPLARPSLTASKLYSRQDCALATRRAMEPSSTLPSSPAHRSAAAEQRSSTAAKQFGSPAARQLGSQASQQWSLAVEPCNRAQRQRPAAAGATRSPWIEQDGLAVCMREQWGSLMAPVIESVSAQTTSETWELSSMTW